MTNNYQILLVEDDDRLGSLTQEYLTQKGLNIAWEQQSDIAVSRILEEQPDLVILDLMLPGMDGFDICRAIKAVNLAKPYRGSILIMTACDDDIDQVLGLELGADDYVVKPVKPRVLLARIRALLRRK